MTERTEPQARERDERSQGNRPSFALFVHSLGWFFLGSFSPRVSQCPPYGLTPSHGPFVPFPSHRSPSSLVSARRASPREANGMGRGRGNSSPEHSVRQERRREHNQIRTFILPSWLLPL